MQACTHNTTGWINSNIVESDFYDELELYKSNMVKTVNNDDFHDNDVPSIVVVIGISLFALIIILIFIKRLHK